MNCVICKEGKTSSGKTTVYLERNESYIIIKDVPAEICQNCGEYYLSEDMTEKVLSIAEEAIQKGIVVEILNFAA